MMRAILFPFFAVCICCGKADASCEASAVMRFVAACCLEDRDDVVEIDVADFLAGDADFWNGRERDVVAI